jgi:hypothetical protein
VAEQTLRGQRETPHFRHLKGGLHTLDYSKSREVPQSWILSLIGDVGEAKLNSESKRRLIRILGNEGK